MVDSLQSQEALVSVVIPCYKAERWIGDTLQSVLQQTYKNLEIIVVDDGSPDALAEIVKEHTLKDARICLIQQENKGLPGARNTGIYAAKGAFIAPLDADDLWQPDKIEKQVKCFFHARVKDPSVGLVYCWSQSIDESNDIIRLGLPRKAKQGRIFDQLLVENFLGNGSSPLILASAVKEVGGYRPELVFGCEDWTLYLMIAHKYSFYAVEEYLVGYRQFASSMSQNVHKMLKGYEGLLKSLHEEIDDLDPKSIRASQESIMLWMLSRAKPFSEDFNMLLRCLYDLDRLFFIRSVVWKNLWVMLRVRVVRLLMKLQGKKLQGNFYEFGSSG